MNFLGVAHRILIGVDPLRISVVRKNFRPVTESIAVRIRLIERSTGRMFLCIGQSVAVAIECAIGRIRRIEPVAQLGTVVDAVAIVVWRDAEAGGIEAGVRGACRIVAGHRPCRASKPAGIVDHRIELTGAGTEVQRAIAIDHRWRADLHVRVVSPQQCAGGTEGADRTAPCRYVDRAVLRYCRRE